MLGSDEYDRQDGSGVAVVEAVQGVEVGWPSRIRTGVTVVDGTPQAMRVGGVAVR